LQAGGRQGNGKTALDLTRTIFEVIDMRSFSNLWYWIALAVVWSSASHYVLGVPYDMVQRARRHGGQAMEDVEDLVRINVGRILDIADVAGLFLMGFWAFVLTGLIVLAFWYEVEFAQAVVLIALPMTLVFALTVRMARIIRADGQGGAVLIRRIMRQRFWTQVIGMVAIFVTAMYGMYQNLAVIPF
jgi:hypothetical protein